MATISKRMKEAGKLVEKSKKYSLEEAVATLKKSPHPKFDESVDLSFKLNVDPKGSQAVRGTVALPNGTGKNVRVAVFCKGESESKAKDAGAEFVGGADLIEKVTSGWCDFDVAIATPEMMRDMGRLGKVLGPRGLMPNPKAGTVTEDVARAIKEVKAGKVEFKMDKQANIHVSIGKISFDEKAIKENAISLIEAIVGAKPQGVKGEFFKSVFMSTTMGPGLKLNIKVKE